MATVPNTNHLSCLSHRILPRHLYICRELSTNQLLFMQNKPNFQKSQMNVIIYNTIDYENISDWTIGQNKPNSNPIKACPERSRMGQFPKCQKMNANVYIIEDYENETAFRPQKNKPKTKPVLSAVEWANFFKGRSGLLTDLKILVTVQSRHR